MNDEDNDERLEWFIGKEKVQTVVEQARELECTEKAYKRPKQAFDMSQ